MAWFKFGKKDSDTVRTQTPVQSIEAMRQRAKHRLIGTVVLVLAGIIGFPMLFDSQPRPVSVDVPIEIPDKAKSKPLSAPSGVTTQPAPAARVDDKASLGGKEEIVSSPVTMPKKDEKTAESPTNSAQAAPKSVVPGVAAGAAAVAAAGAASAIAMKPAAKPPVDEAVKAKAAEAARQTKEAKDKDAKDKEAARAKSLLDGVPAKTDTKVAVAAAPAAAPGAAQTGAETRYIVQFGAFAEADKAQEARNIVEKAGLKTYSQITETAQGKRIRVRVGPFTNKDEADKAANKIKAAGLPASILTL